MAVGEHLTIPALQVCFFKDCLTCSLVPVKEHAKLDPDELKARQQQRSREALLRLASEKAAERQRREERLNKLKVCYRIATSGI